MMVPPQKQARLEGVSGSLPLKVRKDIQIEEQVYEGKTYYVAKDPLTLRYYRMKELEYLIFTLLDGTREIKSIQEEIEKRFGGLKVNEGQIREFILMLRNFNFLETYGPHSHDLLYRRRGIKRWARIKQKLINFFFITIPLTDPDRFLNKAYPYLKFFCSKSFFYLWLLFMAIFLVIMVTHLEEFFHQITGFFNLKNLAMIWVAIMIIKTLHEVGHSLVCKHFGGEVHELGILLIIFTPWMYTNVSDAWIFQTNRQRFLVTVAGIMTELLVAAIASIFWWLTNPGLFNSLCYNIIIVCSIDNLFRNANPLLRYDGYYALSDLVEIPNLRMRALGYLNFLMKKYLLRLPIPDSDPNHETSKRRRWIFLIYGPLSFLYLNFIVLAIAGFVGQRFFIFGLMLAGLIIFRSFILPIQKGLLFAFRHRSQIGYSRPVLLGGLFVFLTFVFFLVFYKVPLRVVSPCSVEPLEYIVVRTEGSGFLKRIFRDQGEKIKQGEVIALLENPELMMQYEKLRLTHAILKAQKRKAFGIGEFVSYDQIDYEIGKVERELAKLEEKIDKLKIVAPQEGLILSPKLIEMKGDFFPEGAFFCELGYLDGVQIRIVISEGDVSEVAVGLPVKLKVSAYADRVFYGEVMEISPARIENLENPALSSKFGGSLPTERLTKVGEMPKLPFFQITMRIDNPEGLLKPGMTGISKIYSDKRSIIALLWRRVLRLIKPERILLLK